MILTSPRTPKLSWCCVLVFAAASAADATAQAATQASILGTWHGTSLCADKAVFPACHDEEVIYVVRPAPQSPDSVILRADKVVNGSRDFMGELVFGQGPGGEWSSAFRCERCHCGDRPPERGPLHGYHGERQCEPRACIVDPDSDQRDD